MPEFNWIVSTKQDRSLAMTMTCGEYIGLVEQITPSEDTGYRNRLWWIQHNHHGESYTVASGFCSGSEKARSIVEFIVTSRS